MPGANAPFAHAVVFGKGKKEKGLVLGKTKSEVAAAEIREVEAVAVRRTHPPRSVVPRTTAKGVFTSINRTLFLTAVVALLVLRTRPLCNVTTSIYAKLKLVLV